MIISQILACIGVIITGTQTLLTLFQGTGICLNEGCKIVDTRTLVEPLYFNIAGCLFFLIALFSLQRARHGSELWHGFTSLILLAALGAEAVLFCFQLVVVDTFCSYCLIILGIVVLMNFFLGLTQLFRGLAVFLAVTIAFVSLNFSTSTHPATLESGVIARVLEKRSDTQAYLFFSSSCPHCEKILSMLENKRTCSMNFNPIDRLEGFRFPDMVPSAGYTPEHNTRLLQHLGLREVPVLIVRQENTQTVISGARGIVDYLQAHCLDDQPASTPSEPVGQTKLTTRPVIPSDDGCLVVEDCADQTSVETSIIGQSPVTEEQP